MSVSQNLLGLFNAQTRSPIVPGAGAEPEVAGAEEGSGAFAQLLAEQYPEQVKALFASIDAPALAANAGTELAADGKLLPETMQAFLDELTTAGGELLGTEDMLEADPSAIAEVAAQWMQWLDEARTAQAQVVPAEAQTQQTGLLAPGPASAQWQDADGEPLAGQSTRQPIQGNEQNKQALDSIANQDQASRRGAHNQSLSADAAAPVQRVAAQAGAVEGQAVFASKLAEQLEPAIARRSPSEPESIDQSGRLGSNAGQAAQAALTARPVMAAPQTLGVPFGQPSWTEAMVEKVLWMSSQNLRSVEIHLDPAELGPLEIHIQNRGQEHQVQFISQNPSVREALESQVFRLREMFSQQGLDQPNVSVADSAVGQQGRDARGDMAGGGGSDRSGADRDDRQVEEVSSSLMTTTAAARAASDRLVDYYA